MQARLRGKARDYERKAQQIRQFAGVSPQAKFDPFQLAARCGFTVIAQASQLQGILGANSDLARRLLIEDPQSWSGGAVLIEALDQQIIYLNPTHSPTRQAATLMEEICHLLLQHPNSKLFTGMQADQARTYHDAIEEEAYGVGAAVLLPAQTLLELVEKQLPVKTIASNYGVSEALVRFRMKIVGMNDY